jgi:hypothetical protein
MAQAPPGDDLIRRNRALLTRAAASRAYTALLREETPAAMLTAYLARLRAWLLSRPRGAPSLPPGPA